MKVIKPQTLSLLSRPFEYRGAMFCGIAILAMVPLGGRRALLAESAMWPMVADVLGSDALLDEAMPKRRAEFLVGGSAWARPDETTSRSRVRVRLGQLEKMLNVLGDRELVGGDITRPEPFDSMALSWSNAFGGEGFARNPLGKGYRATRNREGAKCYSLPNIEYPDDMMYRPGQRPAPAGFGAIDVAWQQRQSKAGTHDDKWFKSEYPGFPRDIDWSFFNLASDDQQQAGAFRGDEAYRIDGMHPEKPSIRGELPGIAGRCFARRRGQSELEEAACRLTTVWFFPDREYAVLIFHASLRCEQPDGSDLGEVMIAADDLAAPRSRRHFAEVFARRMDAERGAFEALRDCDLIPAGLEVPDAAGLDEMTESIRTGQLRRRMKDEMAEGRKHLESEMARIGVDVPEPDRAPDFGFDPEDLDSIRLEDLPGIIDRMERYSLEKRPELEQMQREGQEHLDATMDDLKRSFPDAEMTTPDDGTGPPDFHAEDRERSIRKSLDDMESEGFDVSDIRAGLLGPEMLDLLRFAEKSSIQSYRMSAGHDRPAARSTEARKLGKRLVEAIAQGHCVDARDFTGADLSGVDLAGANLAGVFLESSNLEGANLAGADLRGAVLAHADFRGAVLDGAKLSGANLNKAQLNDARAHGADFGGAQLNEAVLAGTSFEGASLLDTEFRDATWAGATLARADLAEAMFMDQSLDGLELGGVRLADAVFINTSVDGADFSKGYLGGASFVHCSAVGARFSDGDLNNLRVVEDSDFSDADFSRANLVESCLRETTLAGCCFAGTDVSRADFSDSCAAAAVFHRAVALEARFVQTDLRSADCSGANLMNATLERADLRDASLKGANLFGADLARIHVNRATDFEQALTDRMRTYPRKFARQETG